MKDIAKRETSVIGKEMEIQLNLAKIIYNQNYTIYNKDNINIEKRKICII